MKINIFLKNRVDWIFGGFILFCFLKWSVRSRPANDQLKFGMLLLVFFFLHIQSPFGFLFFFLRKGLRRVMFQRVLTLFNAFSWRAFSASATAVTVDSWFAPGCLFRVIDGSTFQFTKQPCCRQPDTMQTLFIISVQNINWSLDYYIKISRKESSLAVQ